MQDLVFGQHITPQTSEMWLVYADNNGTKYYQPWQDVETVGTLIDPASGDDLEMIGWTTEDPFPV